jgi:type I restriction enzyme S subunit
VPFWTLYRRTKRTGFPAEKLLSVYRDHGVVVRSSRDDNNNNASEDLSSYQLVEPGDLAINKMKAWQGSVAVSNHRGIVSPAYFVYRRKHNEDSRFLHYLLRSAPYTALYARISTGVRPGQWDLDPQQHSRIPIVIPPTREQVWIADYLDEETAKIDVLVEKQERLIETLAERRRAVISNAVTKGLDAGAPMKESGVQWLGSVPAEWKVRPLWSMFARVKDVAHPDEMMLSVFREFGVVAKSQYANLNQTAENRDIYQLVGPGWLVTNRMKAWQGSVGISALTGIVSGHYICFRPLHRENSAYLNYLFRSTRYAAGYRTLSRGVRIGQAEIDNDQYRLLPVVVPPSEIQGAIVSWLDSQTSRIDILSLKASDMIAVLKERRQALISAAVTGKIDVRGLV